MARATASQNIPGWSFRRRRAVGLRSRRGISLVEVLVVVAVLVIGMLAILRLFPEGFQSLNFTGNITNAQRLMSLREEELRAARENLPDAIYGIDPANPLNILSTTQPNDYLGTLKQFNISGQNVDDPRFSDVNIARRVFGEQFQVPPASLPFGATSESVSLYRALFGPIYYDSTSPTGSSPAGAGVAAYEGTPLGRVVFNDPPRSENFRAITKLGHFGIGVDYQNAYLYVISSSAPAAGRQFKVDYRFHIPSGGTMVTGQAPADNTAYFPPGATGDDPQFTPAPNPSPTRVTLMRFNMRTGSVDQLVTYDFNSEGVTTAPGPGGAPPAGVVWNNLPANGALDVGSDFSYRRFKQIALATTFTDDPFEFKVYDATTGLFGFNPRAASFPLTSGQGRGIMAKIDYDIDDWHILHYDDAAPVTPTDSDGNPASGDEAYAIKLPTGPIKRLDDTEEILNFQQGGALTNNSYQYQNLIRYYPDTAARANYGFRFDLIVVDLATGYQIDSRHLQRPGPDAPAGTDNAAGEIDYRAGVVRLWKYAGQAGGGAPPTWSAPFGIAGATQAIDPAGRHLRIYYRAASDFAVASFKPFSQFYLQTNAAALAYRQYYANDPTFPGGYVLFPNVDAEKTVAVDYTYLFDPAGGGGPPANYQRRDVYGELHQVQPPGTAFAPPAAPGRWWVRLNHVENLGAGDSAGDTNMVPGSLQVTGVRGASLTTRVAWLEGKRMRHRERSTLLTREVTR